eukprot:5344554-Alexandrium_andersonii.AAC.1
MQEEAGEVGKRSRQASAPAPPSRSVSSVTPRGSSRASSRAGGEATSVAEATHPPAACSSGDDHLMPPPPPPVAPRGRMRKESSTRGRSATP